jgi:GntR family transcriptional regulator
VYLQLVQQVRRALMLGLLLPGDQLPTVKEVVGHLAINPNTVLKAYRELDREGLVEARRGQGTFISRELVPAAQAEHAELREALLAWIEQAREAGFDEDGVVALVAATLQSAFAKEAV